jgi:hypothetical protein
MKTFVQEVKRIANSLHCDGRSLQPPRVVLQKPIDALMVIPEFNVEVARGQTILEQAQVTLSELNRFFIVIVDAARFKFPGVNNIVAAFFPLVCSNCGGAGHDTSTTALLLVVDPSPLTTARPIRKPWIATYGFVIALMTAALATLAVIVPPVTILRPTGVGINGLSVLPLQRRRHETKESNASSVCAVMRPRSGSPACACAAPPPHLPTVLLLHAANRT